VSLKSMTGFGAADGALDGGARWGWEARSVNGKSLDVRLRTPPGFDGLEAAARAAAGERFARGSITLSLTVSHAARTPRMRVNADALSQALAAATALSAQSGLAPATADGVLALRGVIEIADDDAGPDDALRAAARNGLAAALDALAQARAEEGARLATILKTHLARIDSLSQAAADAVATRDAGLKDRLTAALAVWSEAAPPLSEERIAQEAALLLVKADVREELDRLRAHVDALRALAEGGGPVGRKADFLCQELNREANTLCSKSQDAALTGIGVDLKTAIDQLREQVQNVE